MSCKPRRSFLLVLKKSVFLSPLVFDRLPLTFSRKSEFHISNRNAIIGIDKEFTRFNYEVQFGLSYDIESHKGV